MRNRKEVDSQGRIGEDRKGEFERRETVIRIYYMKSNLFNKIKKQKEKGHKMFDLIIFVLNPN